MFNDLFSVIVPVYNADKYLEERTQSIFNQTYPNIEVIFIDDCSTDESWQVLEKIKAQHTNVILHKNAVNQGAGASRNIGLNLANGKYVFFADADDELELNLLEKAYKTLEKEQSDFVFISFKHILKDKIVFKSLPSEALIAQDMEQIRKLSFKLPLTTCTKVLRTSFLKSNDIKFPSIYSGEDYCWSLHLIFCAKKVSFINECLYKYIMTEGSITSGNYARDIFACYAFSYELLCKYGLNDTLQKELHADFIEFYCNYCKSLNHQKKNELIESFRSSQHPQLVSERLNNFKTLEKFPFYKLLPSIFFKKTRKDLKESYIVYSRYKYAANTLK